MDDSEDEESVLLRHDAPDFMAKFKSIMTAEVDMAAKVSLITDAFMDFLGKSPDDPESAYQLWYAQVVVWLTSMLEKRPEDRSIFFKTDDRLTDAAWYAALKSFVVVTAWLREPNTHQYFNVQELALHELESSLLQSVMACYHHFAEEDAIEKCWEFINLRNNIVEAAELAKYFISSNKDRKPLPDNDYDDKILSLLEMSLSGKYLFEETGTSALASYMEKQLAKVREDKLVGRGGELEKIRDRLITGTLKLEITPIVGMGGIVGKIDR